jgi:hypothetical protein
VKLPLTVLAEGIPSLRVKLWKVNAVLAPGPPTTLNLSLINAPGPESADVPKAEIMKRPACEVFGVTVMPLLNVPAMSNEGFSGCSTLSSNCTDRSYDMTPCPDRSVTVIGMSTSAPVSALELGSVTVTVVGAVVWPECESGVSGATESAFVVGGCNTVIMAKQKSRVEIRFITRKGADNCLKQESVFIPNLHLEIAKTELLSQEQKGSPPGSRGRGASFESGYLFLAVNAAGVPSLNVKLLSRRPVLDPGGPITSNFILSNVPAPASFPVPKADITNLPGDPPLAVMTIALLNVSDVSVPGN